MFINEAFAQTASVASPSGVIEFLTPLVVVVAIFYMLVWRPQGKRMKAHEELVQSLNSGDTVITTGGIHGTVVNTSDEATVVLEVATGVDVKFSRLAITAVLETAKSTKKTTSKKTTNKKTKKAA